MNAPAPSKNALVTSGAVMVVVGVMARLDKTFSTNDCSLCIIAPKLVVTSDLIEECGSIAVDYVEKQSGCGCGEGGGFALSSQKPLPWQAMSNE